MNRFAPSIAIAGALFAASACTEKKEAPKAAQPAPAAAPAPMGPLTAEQEARAKLAVRESCQMCHSAEMLEQQRLTPAQWAANVKKMQGWGAPLEGDDLPLVTAYLAKHQGLEAGPWAMPPVSKAQAEAALAPTPDGPFADGDAKRGQAVYASSCASCHGPDARGAAVGINLVDRPVLYRAAEFAEVVRKGRNKMPQAAYVQNMDIAALLAYLRTLRG
jgi:mono/diheme cytochrome c family protein